MDKRRMRLPFIRAVLIELSCWVSLDSGVGLAMDWTRNLNHDSDHAQPEITQPGRVMARSPPAITTGSAAAPAYPGIHFPTSTAVCRAVNRIRVRLGLRVGVIRVGLQVAQVEAGLPAAPVQQPPAVSGSVWNASDVAGAVAGPLPSRAGSV